MFKVEDVQGLRYVGVANDVGRAVALALSRGARGETVAMVEDAALSPKDLWKATLASHARIHNALPPDNQPQTDGNDVWDGKPPPPQAVLSPAVRSAVAAFVDTQTCVVVDDALEHGLVDLARRDAETLTVAAVDAQAHLGTRRDEIAIVASGADGCTEPGTRLQGATSAGALVFDPRPKVAAPGLRAAAALLAAVPAAIRDATTAHHAYANVQPPPVLQLARYSEGGFYATHLDNDPSDDSASSGPPGLRSIDRTVTCILYLNPRRWDESWGGQLRVYSEDGSTHETISPVGGRLVLFDSRSTPHQVLKATHERWAISAWLASTPVAL